MLATYGGSSPPRLFHASTYLVRRNGCRPLGTYSIRFLPEVSFRVGGLRCGRHVCFGGVPIFSMACCHRDDEWWAFSFDSDYTSTAAALGYIAGTNAVYGVKLDRVVSIIGLLATVLFGLPSCPD